MIILAEIDKLMLKIESLRENLNRIIKEGKDLKHPDVLKASKKLDKILNKYQKLLQDMIDFDDIDS